VTNHRLTTGARFARKPRLPGGPGQSQIRSGAGRFALAGGCPAPLALRAIAREIGVIDAIEGSRG
jgi:hypothetical protein